MPFEVMGRSLGWAKVGRMVKNRQFRIINLAAMLVLAMSVLPCLSAPLPLRLLQLLMRRQQPSCLAPGGEKPRG